MSLPLVKIGNQRINLFNVTHITPTHLTNAEQAIRVYYTDGTFTDMQGAEAAALLEWYDEAATDLTPVAEPAELDSSNQEERAAFDLGD